MDFISKLSITKAMQILSISRLGGAILAGIILVKLGVPIGTIGLIELLFFLGKSATVFWSDALTKAILPLFPQLADKQQRHFFATATFLYLSFALLTYLVLMLFKPAILTYFLKVDDIPYYNIYVLYLTLNVPGLLLEQYFILKKDATSVLWYTLLSYVLYPIYFLVPILLGLDISAIFYVLIVVAGIRLLWIGVLLSKEYLVIDPIVIRRLLRLVMHFTAYVLVAIMAEVVDGFIINYKYSDPAVFAMFRYGARELPITTALIGGLSLASIANLSEDFTAHLPQFKKSLNRILVITFPIALILMLSSQWLFVYFFSEEFRESAFIFNTYLLILGSRVLMFGPLVMAKLESRFMFKISLYELVTNVVLSLILVQYWGIIGIALATVISSYIEKVAYFFLLGKRHNLSFSHVIDKKRYLIFWLSLHVAYIGAWFLPY